MAVKPNSITTPQANVQDYSSILSGSYWDTGVFSGGEMVVTYSFAQKLPPQASDDGAKQSFLNSFRPLSAAEESAARKAIKQWDDACGITFVEANGSSGDMVFGAYNFEKEKSSRDSAAFAYYPSGDWLLGGDVFINSANEFGESEDVHLYIHEIGHALGLKHPFEDFPILDPAYDHLRLTVMSYNGDYRDGRTISPFDIQAIREIYGEDAGKRKNKNAAENLFGTNSKDTLSGHGGKDQINGYGCKDKLSGGKGNDRIDGGFGADTLTGGQGRDTFFLIWLDATDRIKDFKSGTDRLAIDSDMANEVDLFKFEAGNFVLGTAAQDADDYIIYDRNSGILRIDLDGNGGDEIYTVAKLGAGTALQWTDLIAI